MNPPQDGLNSWILVLCRLQIEIESGIFEGGRIRKVGLFEKAQVQNVNLNLIAES